MIGLSRRLIATDSKVALASPFSLEKGLAWRLLARVLCLFALAFQFCLAAFGCFSTLAIYFNLTPLFGFLTLPVGVYPGRSGGLSSFPFNPDRFSKLRLRLGTGTVYIDRCTSIRRTREQHLLSMPLSKQDLSLILCA